MVNTKGNKMKRGIFQMTRFLNTILINVLINLLGTMLCYGQYIFLFFWTLYKFIDNIKSLNIKKVQFFHIWTFFATTVKNRYNIVFHFKCSSSVTSEKEDSHKLTAFGGTSPLFVTLTKSLKSFKLHSTFS